jgi:hypothetical protein
MVNCEIKPSTIMVNCEIWPSKYHGEGSSQDADANFGDVGSATFSAKREFCIIKVLKERCENNEKICLGLFFFKNSISKA